MDPANVIAIVKKELRTYFNSPIAYAVLVLFVGLELAVFFNFFFWSRGVADMRPFFELLPVLFLVLIPALTMRIWSEEKSSGTLEVLLTFPLRVGEVVLGKYLAGMVLISCALLLTFGVPITVAALGDLDSGPVIGGYLGALLLGSAYLAVGMAASSMTKNQVLALLMALVACLALWAVGEPFFTKFLTQGSTAFLAKLGTGSRFRSVARGVIDLRDLVYYLSLAGLFLYGNAAILSHRRS